MGKRLTLPHTVDGFPIRPGMNVWTPGSAWCEDEEESGVFNGYPVEEVVLVKQHYNSTACVWRLRWEGSGDLHWVNNVYGRRENLPEMQEAAQRDAKKKKKKKPKKHP